MPKKAQRMTGGQIAAKVRKLREEGGGVFATGGADGLNIQVNAVSASWVLRYKNSWIVLGLYDHTGGNKASKEREHSFAEMIVEANTLRKSLKSGELDPYALKKSVKAKIEKRESIPAFREAAEDYLDITLVGFKNAKHQDQWRNTLRDYVYDGIGNTRLDYITLNDVAGVLKPLWKDAKYETAERLLGRICSILDHAVAKGYIKTSPVQNKAHVYTLLGAKHADKKNTVHHESLPYKQAPALLAQLKEDKSGGAKALELVLLTAVRSNEARGARWGEFNLDAKMWTIPADRMKGKKPFEVALSERAIELIKSQGEGEADELVFKAARGGMLYDTAPSAVLKDLTDESQTVHGLRSTFRTWAAETRASDRDVVEFCLAHQLPDAVEASYQRSQLFDLRLVLMNKWAAYLEQRESTGTVVNFPQLSA